MLMLLNAIKNMDFAGIKTTANSLLLGLKHQSYQLAISLVDTRFFLKK